MHQPPGLWNACPAKKGYRVRAALDGQPRSFMAIDQTIAELGWTLTVMADDAPVAQARIYTWVLATLAAGLTLLGGLFWRLRERRFREQRDARRELEVQVRERTSELQEAHAFRKAMEDSLLVGMRARDLQGRIVYVNPALCDITGYGADELLGRLPPYPYWHPDDLERHWQNNDASLSGRAALTGFESRILHKSGREVHTMVYTAPLIDAAGAAPWLDELGGGHQRAKTQRSPAAPACQAVAAQRTPGQPGRNGIDTRT